MTVHEINVCGVTVHATLWPLSYLPEPYTLAGVITRIFDDLPTVINGGIRALIIDESPGYKPHVPATMWSIVRSDLSSDVIHATLLIMRRMSQVHVAIHQRRYFNFVAAEADRRLCRVC